KALIVTAKAAPQPMQPDSTAKALRDLGARSVCSEKWRGKIFEERRAVGESVGAELVECLDRRTARISGRLQHQRWNCANQHRLGDAFRSVTSDVARDFTASCGVTDMNRILQIERF